MNQIFKALLYLHKNNIVHRDLNPENILCEGDQIKIGDFGLSRFIDEGTLLKTMCGTPLYVPPEILTAKPYSGDKIDVWSSGVILYVMVCGYPPFDEGTESGNRVLFNNISNGRFEFKEKYWGSKSDEVKDLTNGLTFAGIVTCGAPDHEKTTAGIVQSLSSLATFVPGWRWAGAKTTSTANGLTDEALKQAFELGKAAVEKALA